MIDDMLPIWFDNHSKGILSNIIEFIYIFGNFQCNLKHIENIK